MALAIAYVWITEGLYDKDYVAARTTGFEKWRDYILGKEDGIPKTPEWQEKETGVPAKDVRALAREWGTKKTYLAAGGPGSGVGGACRCATGIEWARSMVCLMAMQGLGKPGVNMGNMARERRWIPSSSSRAMRKEGSRVIWRGRPWRSTCTSGCPNSPRSTRSCRGYPRLKVPEAILEGHCEGYPTNPKTIEGQFFKFSYPAPGNAEIKMYYKYGGSFIGTMCDTNRYVKAYRTPKLVFCGESVHLV